MKKYIAGILSICLTASLIAKDKDVTHTLTLTNPDKVATIGIELTNGHIQVEGYNGKTVEVRSVIQELKKVAGKSFDDVVAERVERKMYGDDENSRKRPSTKGLKQVKNTSINLEMGEYNNRVSIESNSKSQNIQLFVKVPFNSNLVLENNRGDGITITNVHGTIEAEANRGSISATGIRGPIVAEASRNDITVVFDQYNVKKPSSLITHRGNLDITLPKSASVTVEVKNYGGEIYSGLDAEFTSLDEVINDKSSRRQQITVGGAMTASVNGGKQKLSLNTYRGDVFLRTK